VTVRLLIETFIVKSCILSFSTNVAMDGVSMSNTGFSKFFPLVKGETTATNPNVASVMDQLKQGRYYIPEYQRDSSEWSDPKRSLFIESLINNMTIPPLIVYPDDDPATGRERKQIVDGQQRLSTIRDFINDEFALSSEAEVEYAPNVGPLIQGKRYSQLGVDIQDQIRGYTLNFIVLPKNLDLNLRLEIFRRINEGGVPLSAQDLRLAIFGQSPQVYFIRLAGVFDTNRDGAQRMIKAGQEIFQLSYPWKNPTGWKDWWHDTTHAAGQAPSQMFLYYVLARDLTAVQTILDSEKVQQTLRLKYDRTTVSVLDLYCAQAQQEQQPNSPAIIVSLSDLQKWFEEFEAWFNAIKLAKVPGVSVNSATKLAFFIAGATTYWSAPEKVTEEQWESIQFFLTQGPGPIKEKLGRDFSTTRGKWPGQLKQIEQTVGICELIATI